MFCRAALLHLLRLAFAAIAVHFITGGHFIAEGGTKVQGLKSPFLCPLAAFTPIASYRRIRAFRFAIG